MKLSRFGASMVAAIAAPSATLLLAAQLTACGGSETATSSSNDASFEDANQGGDAGSDASQGSADGGEGDGDATTSSSDASGDSGDATVADAGSDSGDASTVSDASSDSGDATVANDASGDSGGSDSSPEGSADASADVAADVVNEVPDAQGADAAPEADQIEAGPTCSVSVPTVDNYFDVVTAAACQSLQSCCGLSASQFNTAKCLTIFRNTTYGGWMDVGFPEAHLNSGKITYNAASSCSCIQQISSISCGLVPAANWDSTQGACDGALEGNVAIGSSCASSYECVPGSFCTAESGGDPADGGPGTCEPLVALGGGCFENAECSYVADGSPSAYCNAGHCATAVSAGNKCGVNSDCASNVCLNSLCQGGVVFSDPLGSGGRCDFYTNPAEAGATPH